MVRKSVVTGSLPPSSSPAPAPSPPLPLSHSRPSNFTKKLSKQVRSALKRQKAGKYGARVKAQQAKRKHAAANPTPRDELLDVFK